MPLQPLIQRIKHLISPPKHAVIIVGVDYDSYQIHNAIKSHCKRYFTAFFIDEDPWNHRNCIDNAQLRYPVEWRALCRNHKVAAIICTTDAARKALMDVKVLDARELDTRLLVVAPEEIKQCGNVDLWLTQQIEEVV